MKELIKKLFKMFGLEITKYYNRNNNDTKCISLKADRLHKGNVLLSLWIEPFLLKEGEPVPNTHTHNWDSLQIAKIFLNLGYNVDVIDYRNKQFIPEKDYTFFVAFRTNFERITRLLNPDSIKIVLLDTAHWIFNNYSSYRRLLDLQKRKNVTVKWSQKTIEQNLAVECADYITIIGDSFTISTYTYIGKPIYRIPHSTSITYSWPEDKNYESCRKNYLWIGSDGLVHKGLDLVLDTFVKMPDYHLYICGPIQREEDFARVYHKELFQTSNIHTVGWVDISGSDFIEIMNKCIGIIYPSCSECAAGSAITCMHAGLIPIISYESGLDIEDSFGVILNNCSIDEIKSSIKTISDLPAEELKVMSRKAWEFARANYTRERFAEGYRKFVEKIIDTKSLTPL